MAPPDSQNYLRLPQAVLTAVVTAVRTAVGTVVWTAVGTAVGTAVVTAVGTAEKAAVVWGTVARVEVERGAAANFGHLHGMTP